MRDLLAGVRVVALTTNLPGPLAAARLRSLGAAVTKIEPLGGDPLQAASSAWYERVCAGLEVVRLDLKAPADRERAEAELSAADVLLTTMRPRALRRVGLDWEALHGRFPRLCHVAIVGERAPHGDRAGHDLTYQARAGLVAPPALPTSVYADMLAAESAVTAVLAALYARERTGSAAFEEIAIADCAGRCADAVRYGVTSRGGPLGGGLSTYALYASADGWIALAVLEPHFRERLAAALGSDRTDAAWLRERFAEHPSVHWDALAERYGIPLAPVAEIAGSA